MNAKHTEASISIIIPTHNRLKTLQQVIPSYISQDQVSEIIIVDDASTDATREFVQSLQTKDVKIVYVRNEKKLGAPATRNVGVQHASEKYIVFGEDDLRFWPGYAIKLANCLERNNASIAGGRILFPFPDESDEEALHRTSASVSQRLNKSQIMFDASSQASDEMEVPFIHACSMIRRDVFESVQYDPGYKGNAYREETDFYIRAGRHGHKIIYCPDAICVHLPREVHQLGGSMAQGVWIHKYWSIRNNFRFLRRHYKYLKQQNWVQGSFTKLMIFFTVAQVKKIPSFYLRRYSPTLYRKLAKYFS